MEIIAAKTDANRWYSVLLDRIHALSRKYDLPEDIANDVQTLTVEVAKEQYKVGNKSGIAWLLKKQSIEGIRPRTTAVAV